MNASQAIENTGTVTITTACDNEFAYISFTDSGSGIAPEHLNRIFDPGFTTKKAGVGTGLGLSIVHQIIQAHNGRIEVESKLGSGTTFKITLPFKE